MSGDRPVGTLTAADLGKQCRVEFEGWTHTGALAFVHHETSFRGEPRAFMCVRSESGARWMKHLPADHPIEIHEGTEDANA